MNIYIYNQSVTKSDPKQNIDSSIYNLNVQYLDFFCSQVSIGMVQLVQVHLNDLHHILSKTLDQKLFGEWPCSFPVIRLDFQ